MTPEYLPLDGTANTFWIAVISTAVLAAGVFAIWRLIRTAETVDLIGCGLGIVFASAVLISITAGIFGWVSESAIGKNLVANVQTKYEIRSLTLGNDDNGIRQVVVTLPDGQTASYVLTYNKVTGEPTLAATGAAGPSPSSLERQ